MSATHPTEPFGAHGRRMVSIRKITVRGAVAARIARAAWAAMAILAVCQFAHADLNIVLQEAPAGTTLNPNFDANLNELGDIMEAAAQYWEGIIKDNHTVTVTYGYADLGPGIHGLAQVTGDDGVRATTGNVALDIQNNTVGDWYFDQTPTNHSEFSMHQVLYRDLGGPAQNLYYDGAAPDVLEVGYWGNYVGSDQGRDALTVAVHELGHILGLSGALPNFAAQTADGEYDFSIFYTHGVATRVNYHSSDAQERDHVRASDATMAVGAGNGDRNLPGATDVFAAASVSNWLQLDLPRKDFWGNGQTNWNNSFNWPGNRVPDAEDEIHVRNGADAALTTSNGFAGNLYVREESTVSTGTNSLHITDKATIEGFDPGAQANLVINAGGRVTADEIELNEGGLLTVTSSNAAGLVEVDVDEVDINTGGVLLGNGDVRFANLLRNDGTISAIAGAGDTLSLLSGSLDLDGLTGDGRVFATLGDLRISAPLADGFDGEMTIGQGREVVVFSSWDLGQSGGGHLEFQGGALTPAVLTTNLGTASFVLGDIEVSGQAEVNGPTVFEAGMTTTIAESSARFTLHGPATLRGGVFQGEGTLRFEHTVNVEDPTTIGSRIVDLDGQGGSTEINLNFSPLTLNVDRVDSATNNRFDGTINLTGSGASLIVNLNDGNDSWQMDGTLNASVAGLISQTALVGSPVEVSGTINATGFVNISAPMDLSGSVNLTNVLTSLGLHGGPHIVRNTATLDGVGTLRVHTTGHLFAEHSSVIGVEVNNRGRFEPGTSIGATTITEDFNQTSTGTLAMELAGAPFVNHDLLDVLGIADLDGELEVTAINGFVPTVGDTYTLLTASSVVDTFDTLTLLSDSIFKFDASLVYPGARVVLRIDDVTMFGDFNDDLTLDCTDIDALVAEIASGGMSAEFDLNGDMTVDGDDLSMWLAEAGEHNVGGAYLPGDANLDGFVNGQDFVVWNQNKFMNLPAWCSGDFNADGFVNGGDFVLWNANKFMASDAFTAVPEPGSVPALLLPALLLLSRRRAKLQTSRKMVVATRIRLG